MSALGGVAGLSDWQWLFLLEAVPALLAGIAVWRFLPDGPQDAGWLDDDERRWLASRLEGEEQARLRQERHTLREVFKDGRVLAFALLYFCMVVNVYGLSFWVGEMVDKINGLSDVGKGFVTAIPYTVAIVGMVVIPRHSDRTGERKLHVAFCLGLAAASFVVSTVVSPVAAIAALAVGLFFLLGAHGVFWTMPAALLSGAAAAAGIAMINSIGNLGGFAGPYLVGLIKDATGSTDGGLIVLAAILACGALLATRVAHQRELERPPETRTGRFDRTPAETPAEQTVQ
jgi:nitrate/nitrite transporter NarK